MAGIRWAMVFGLMVMAGAAAAQDGTRATSVNDSTTPITITVNGTAFRAALLSNPTAAELLGRLPLDLEMSDLNGNEKFLYFKYRFPTSPVSVGRVQVGDLMLYGDNCLVLFYEGFATPYPYTRLGRISDTTGLVQAVGRGLARVRLARE